MPDSMEEMRDSTRDFLAHLRLVHFGLAATSVALLVASTMAPPYVLENAYRQAGELRRIESISVSHWLDRYASPTNQVRKLFEAGPFSVSNGSTTLSIGIDDWAFYVNRESLIEHVRAELVSLARYGEPGVPFDTLSDFRGLWNDLRRMRETPAIVAWSPADADFMPLGVSEWMTGNLTIVGGSGDADAPHLHGDRTEFVRREDGRTALVIWFRDVSHGVPAIAKAIRVPVTLERVNYQDLLSSELRVDWRSGEFSDSFKDLERFAKNLGSLSFPELEDHLGRLAAEVGPPIQIFGAAIPVRSLRTWGPAILVATQAYFLLHFRRFRRTIRDPSRSQFAWLGIYDDLLSRTLFSCSVSLLPVVAVLVIGVLPEYIVPLTADPTAVFLLAITTSSLAIGFATLLEVNETLRRLFARLLCRRLTRACS